MYRASLTARKTKGLIVYELTFGEQCQIYLWIRVKLQDIAISGAPPLVLHLPLKM